MIIQIDQSYPFLQNGGTGINFYEGGGAFILASNNLVRVNYRGIHTYKSARLNIQENHNIWKVKTCNLSAFSMCNTGDGHIFPYFSPRIGNTSLEYCVKSLAKVIINNPNIYDYSSCDILDQSQDLIYTDSLLYIRTNNIDIWKYWAMVLCCIYLIRSVSVNLIGKLESNSVYTPQYPAIIVSLTAWLIVLCDWDSYYITSNDIVFFWVSIGYVGLYLGFHAYHAYVWYMHTYYYNHHNKQYMEPKIFNMSTATIQLVTARLYASTETPYIPVILFLLLTRIWEKEVTKKFFHIITGLMDCIYISMLMSIGVTFHIFYLFPIFMITRVMALKITESARNSKTQPL